MGPTRRATFLASVREDLLAIQRDVAERSGSMATAERLVADLRMRCQRLASTKTMMGRSRPDIGADVRSSPYGSDIVFHRYGADRFEVLAIVERHRDMKAFLKSHES